MSLLVPTYTSRPVNGREAFLQGFIGATNPMPFNVYMDNDLRQVWLQEWADAASDAECVEVREATIAANRAAYFPWTEHDQDDDIEMAP